MFANILDTARYSTHQNLHCYSVPRPPTKLIFLPSAVERPRPRARKTRTMSSVSVFAAEVAALNRSSAKILELFATRLIEEIVAAETFDEEKLNAIASALIGREMKQRDRSNECSHDGCKKKAAADCDGMCALHYKKSKIMKCSQICEKSGNRCARNATTDGLCDMHHMASMKKKVPSPKAPKKICGAATKQKSPCQRAVADGSLRCVHHHGKHAMKDALNDADDEKVPGVPPKTKKVPPKKGKNVIASDSDEDDAGEADEGEEI